MNKNIALVGFMGSGKSTIAKLLAKQTGRKLVSIDDLIVQRESMDITDIFSIKGEKFFRDVEENVVCEVSQGQDLIIDCGGGVVLREQNVNNLHFKSIIIYLKTSPDVIYSRIKNQSHRPLVNVKDPKAKIGELLSARESFYEKADVIIDTAQKTPEMVAEEIIKMFVHD